MLQNQQMPFSVPQQQQQQQPAQPPQQQQYGNPVNTQATGYPPQMQQQQNATPGFGHPSPQLIIPPVQSPMPTPNQPQRTAEQIAQEVYQQQVAQQGTNYQQPVVNLTPTPPGQMVQGQQFMGHPQQQQQQQQTAGDGSVVPPNPAANTQQQGFTVDPSISQVATDEAIEYFTQQAQEMGVQNNQEFNKFLSDRVNDASQFDSLEAYDNYTTKMGLFAQSLAKNYGEDNVGPMMEQLRENIVAHGGEELWDNVLSNDTFLDPAFLTPFLAAGESENPYDQYLQGGPSQPVSQAGMAPGQGGQGFQNVRDMSQINAEIQDMYGAHNQQNWKTDAWNQRLLGLMNERNQAVAAQQTGRLF